MPTMVETIADRYELSGRISSGGMGDVYKARDQVLGRTVAVKIMQGDRAADESSVGRFRAEAQAAARLSHANVVQVHDWGRHDSRYFMVMEYVRGRSLRDVISSRERLDDVSASKAMRDVLAGLHSAHAQGLVHRDVKPENVLVSVEGDAKVADFGISRTVESPSTESFFGTVTYVAPERLQGGSGDARSDIYSAGCVLFEALTGSPPFTGDSASVINSHVNERVPPPSKWGADPRLDEVVLKATSPDPEERFVNAEEMAAAIDEAVPEARGADLRELVAELTDEVSRSDMLTAPVTQSRRIGWLPYVALVAAVVAAVVAGLMFRPTTVSDVVGQPVDDAISSLLERGFEVDTREVFASEAVGSVIGSEPDPGSWALRGTTVLLMVSKGPRVVELVDLVGSTLEEARTTIGEAGLLVGEVSWAHDAAALGTVISQDPQPGQVRAGDPVNLVASLGPEVIEVPEVVGEQVADAKRTLEGLGFGVQIEEVFDDAPEGEVISQAPEAGTELEKGEVVGLSVSKGPKPFAMPDVEGKACSAATAELEDLGLEVVLRARTGGCGSKEVLAQDPLPGAEVRKGDEVTIFVD